MSRGAGRRGRATAVGVALAVLATLPAVLAAPPVAAAPGEFDASFGTGGAFTFARPAPTVDIVNRQRFHPSEYRPLAVGVAGTDVVVFPQDGSWGGSWDGPVVVPFGKPSAGYDLVYAVDAGRVTRVVAVGSAGTDFALAAFDRTGGPVRTFGTEGRVTTAIAGSTKAEARTGVKVGQSYLVFGAAEVAGDSRLAIARYTEDGVLDPAFGPGGTTTIDLTPGPDVPATATVTAAGVLVAGQAGGSAFVARFTTDGTLDPSFGTGGVALFDLSAGDDAFTGLVASGDLLLVAGRAGDDAVVARLAGAQLDPSFGVAGTVRTRFGRARASFSDLAVDPRDGAVMAVGAVASGDAALLRISGAGGPDAGFGVNGESVFDLGGADDRGVGVFVVLRRTPDGNLPLPSTFEVLGSDGADAVKVYRDSDGQPLPQIPAQRFELGGVGEQAGVADVQGDGRIVVAGNTGRLLLLARLLPGGSLDTTFRPGGRAVRELGPFSVADMRLGPGGSVWVLGRRSNLLQVARFAANGALDLSFGERGLATVSTSGTRDETGARLWPLVDGTFLVSPGIVHVAANGAVTRRSASPTEPHGPAAIDRAGGIVYAETSGYGMGATRWFPDGRRDSAYYADSRWGEGLTQALAALPDGRALIAGRVGSNQYASPTDIQLIAVWDSGILDPWFGDHGSSRVDIDRFDEVDEVTVLPDGKLVVIGHSTPSVDGTARLTVTRLLPKGGLDATFANGGVLVTSRFTHSGRVRAQGDGRLVLTGETSGGVATVARLNMAAPPVRALRATGWNGYGQLGDGTRTDRRSTVPVPGAGGTIAMAAGANHSLAVRADGTVAAWGWNLTSQLGDGTATDRQSPVTVPRLTGVVGVAAGYLHSLAVKADGTVWAWGWNGYGQLGDGTTALHPTPVQVPGLAGAVAVAAGAYHSMALLADGSVWMWGWNAYGQLGDGTLADRYRPVRLGQGGVTAIAAGAYHSLVLSSNGSIWAFGFNTGLPYRAYPAGDWVMGLPLPAISISAGAYHNLAVLADGSVWSWGWNGLGQLGDGTTVEQRQPVRVPGVSGAAVVAAGAYHSVALLRDGTARAWGWNALGQLGDGTVTDRLAPVAVQGVGAGRLLAAGIVHTLVA